MPYVMERWLPGTITNWVTIHQRIMELERLEKMRDTGEIDRLVKKEGLLIEREIKRLLVHLSGIRNMKGLPELVFIVDVMRENTAVHEANLKAFRSSLWWIPTATQPTWITSSRPTTMPSAPSN
jgi:small subunit ribosomal protein S2